MNKKFDVLVIGELNVDLILNHIAGFPEIGKEKLARQMILTLGSSSAIFASNISSLGVKVAFLGKIGKDVFGDLVIQSLKNKNVFTDFIIRNPELATGATIVINYAEDRAMLTHPGAMEYLTLAEIKKEIFETTRHMHFSSVFLQPGIKRNIVELFRIAKEASLTTSFDAQWDPDEKWDLPLDELLPFVDVFLPNEQELMFLTAQHNVDDALKIIQPYANTVAVKIGNKGSLVFQNGKIMRHESFLNRKVVDAIGAGDSFNAGFIFKFIQNQPLEECQRFGNLMGAVSTTAAGGTAAFTNYRQIMKIAHREFGYRE